VDELIDPITGSWDEALVRDIFGKKMRSVFCAYLYMKEWMI
jgi:hypothetical protein